MDPLRFVDTNVEALLTQGLNVSLFGLLFIGVMRFTLPNYYRSMTMVFAFYLLHLFALVAEKIAKT